MSVRGCFLATEVTENTENTENTESGAPSGYCRTVYISGWVRIPCLRSGRLNLYLWMQCVSLGSLAAETPRGDEQPVL